MYRVLQNYCIKLLSGIEEPKIMGVARGKKSISASLPSYGSEIEKSKHIFINISKTTDLNLTKFCTLAFPEMLFPRRTPSVVVVDPKEEPTRLPPLIPSPGPTSADNTSGPAAPPQTKYEWNVPPRDRSTAPHGPGPSATSGSQICVVCRVVVSCIGDCLVLGAFLG